MFVLPEDGAGTFYPDPETPEMFLAPHLLFLDLHKNGMDVRPLTIRGTFADCKTRERRKIESN